MIVLDGTSGITTPTTDSTGEHVTSVTGFKNRIINGGMVIDQRNAGASVTPAVSGTYTLDRVVSEISQASKFSIQQNAGSVTPPAGFIKYLGITSLSAYSVLAGDYFMIGQNIEGFNVADLGWGSANAQTVTLSFWVRSSLTGTFGGSLVNTNGTRGYGFTYIISTANTWEQKSITVSGDTTGTWSVDNGVGLRLRLGLGAGSSFSYAAGSWGANNIYGITGATSVVGTNGATFYITGVQLEKGSVATSFDYRPYGTELSLCQRYYFKTIFNSGYVATLQAFSATNAFGVLCYPPVPMRAAPSTITTSTIGNFRLYDAAATPAAVTTTFNVAMSTGPLYCTQVSRTGSGMVAGQAVVMDVSTTCYVDASAEL